MTSALFDWNEVALEKICMPEGLVRGPFGGSLKKDDFVTSGYQVYEQRHAINGTSVNARYFIDSKKYSEMKRYSVKPGDFIISCSGTIGRIFQIPVGSPEGVINQALLKISVNTQLIDPRFFALYFRWDSFQSLILDSTQGGAMQNLVGMDIFRKSPISLPSMGEQRAIADALSGIDANTSTIQELITKKQAIKQGMMQELLTGKTRLPGFTSPWSNVRLGEYVTYVKTAALSRAQLDNDSSTRYLHYGDIHSNPSVVLAAAEVLMPRVSSSLVGTAGRLQVGDLIFADASEDTDGVGKSVEIGSVPPEGVIAGLHTIAARFDKSILADGFKAYLQFNSEFRKSLLRLAAGTKVLATTRSYISSIWMMSQLLDAIIEQRRQGTLDYQAHLIQLIEQAQKLGAKKSDTVYPIWADNGARRALIDFGLADERRAIQVDRAIMQNKPDNWLGNFMKEKRVKRAMRRALPPDYDRLDELFDLVKARHEYH